MQDWEVLFKKLLSIESKLKKSRKKDINKSAVIMHVNDCISMITWEIRRCNIRGVSNVIKEINELINNGSFIYKD